MFYWILFLAFVSTVPALAEEGFFVKTADSHYDHGDTIVISGNVGTVIGDTPVIIKISYGDPEPADAGQTSVAQDGGFTTSHPNGTFWAAVQQTSVAQDGGFTTTILAEGPLWKKSGEYTASAFYQKLKKTIKFAYSIKTGAPETKDTFEVKAGNHGTFDVKYTIKGGKVTDMVMDEKIIGMTVSIETSDEGSIALDLPRKYIGAETPGGGDEGFIINIDGKYAAYHESAGGGDSRIITVDFIEGDSKIDIIGTYILPEFGGVAMAILAASIVAVIAVSRGRLQIRA